MTAKTLSGLYRRARAMVFRSLNEGLGAPPLEAMASGRPRGQLQRGLLARGLRRAALLFEPRSIESGAVARIAADTELRERLREAGPGACTIVQWHGPAERHRAIYARVAATRGS